MKNQNGITLIALVITIIVLIILAGVSITALTDNEKGIVTKAKEASEKTAEAKKQENNDVSEIMNDFDSDDWEESNNNSNENTSSGDDEEISDSEDNSDDEQTEDATFSISVSYTTVNGYFTVGYVTDADITISDAMEEDYPFTIEYYTDGELYETQTLESGTTASISGICTSKILIKVINQAGSYESTSWEAAYPE